MERDMTSNDDLDERALVKGLVGLGVGLAAVCVLAGIAWFATPDHSTTGSGARSSQTEQHAPPPGTSR
jgi:hypothetical protein